MDVAIQSDLLGIGGSAGEIIFYHSLHLDVSDHKAVFRVQLHCFV